MRDFNLNHWLLVGPGAVGLYYGGRIAQSEHLGVLARSSVYEIDTNGICIEMVDPESGQTREQIRCPVEYATTRSDEIHSSDCVIIATKSTANEHLIKPLKSIIRSERTIILCLQNGMGNIELFAKYFPENPILLGLCFVCVNRTSPAVVKNYHPGRVEIGSIGDRWPNQAEAVVKVFNQSGIYSEHARVLEAALWRKLCWNVPFNGLSIAAGGISTDKILANTLLIRRARILMQEVRSAAKLAGHIISDSFLDDQFTVTNKMNDYKPSSLIDFLANKPVELEAIWGEPMRRGQALGVKMPELNELYNELKILLKQ